MSKQIDELKDIGKARKMLAPLFKLYGQKIEDSADIIAKSVADLDKKLADNKQQTDKQIIGVLATITKALAERDKQVDKQFAKMQEVIIELTEKETTVKVDAPPVNVEVQPPEQVIVEKSTPAPEPVSEYQPHDQDKKNSFQYSGFVRSDGAWYIQRIAKGEQRYVAGTKDYSESWEKRDKLDYKNINEVM